jgi:hypothetical protein
MQIAAMNLCSYRRNGFSACVAPSQSKHLMACIDQFPNHCRAYKTSCTCNENTHIKNSFSSIFG